MRNNDNTTLMQDENVNDNAKAKAKASVEPNGQPRPIESEGIKGQMNKNSLSDDDYNRAFKAEFDKRLSDFEAALRKAIDDKAIYDSVLKVYAELSKGRGESLALLMAISHIWGQIVGNVYCELEPEIDPGHDAILVQMVTDFYSESLEKLIENRKDMTARQRAEMEEYVAALREHALAEKANRP